MYKNKNSLNSLCYSILWKKPESKHLSTWISQVVQWLRLHTYSVGNMGSNPGRGTKILPVA